MSAEAATTDGEIRSPDQGGQVTGLRPTGDEVREFAARYDYRLSFARKVLAGSPATLERLRGAPCSNYTATKWSPMAAQPEDDRCVNCGLSAADHDKVDSALASGNATSDPGTVMYRCPYRSVGCGFAVVLPVDHCGSELNDLLDIHHRLTHSGRSVS